MLEPSPLLLSTASMLIEEFIQEIVSFGFDFIIHLITYKILYRQWFQNKSGTAFAKS